MSKRLQFLIALTLGVPVVAGAQVPVQDSSYGAAQSAGQGYGGAGAAGAGNGAPVSGMGQLFSQLQQMQDDISRLRGQLEVQENEIRQLKQEGLDRYQDLDGRISQLSSAPANAGAGAAGGSSQAQGGAIAANSTPTPPAAANAPAASSEPADPAKEKLYYEAAFDLIKSKDFDKASQAFNAFLRKYPNSQYAGNAQYWLGEVNLAKGDLQAAGQAFARVSQAYPTSNKVPDSLYKLAGVEQKLGRTDRAKGMYQQVISQYPGTSAAQLAQRDLKSLP
ncbi:tol-pal system protein YbgF [Pseudomonas oryzihabitans]|uniref:tol-pal system protein YbgF n=1 Tax=Pseudomonas oryzihabitans TaxID=47885 RepID=UPI00111C9846|nr:tol-pal system protein YbgF [Pseudomonas psychrotolerans]QDD88882.1 tol-pal system protein YbgF [Pseudomonas psychrotolerans]